MNAVLPASCWPITLMIARHLLAMTGVAMPRDIDSREPELLSEHLLHKARRRSLARDDSPNALPCFISGSALLSCLHDIRIGGPHIHPSDLETVSLREPAEREQSGFDREVWSL